MSGSVKTVNSDKHSSAKNNILKKLKNEVNGADYTKLPNEVAYQYPPLSNEQKIAQFIEHLTANHAQVIKLDATDIAKIVCEQLTKRNISSIMAGKDSEVANLLTKQITQLNKEHDNNITVEFFDFDLIDNKDKLFNTTPAAITGSLAAIAATGSIVLWPTTNEPRSLSLVPPLHFVIVDSQKIFQDFATIMSEQQWRNKLPTNVVLVSGPSKTADIQQTLAYGAHGPKELVVLLLNCTN